MKKNLNHLSSVPENISSPLLLDTNEIVLKKNHRCQHCNKLLGVEHLTLPAFDIKCVRCGHINSIVKDYNRQVIITDKNGVIIYVNEQVLVATGYSSKEILGKNSSNMGRSNDKRVL